MYHLPLSRFGGTLESGTVYYLLLTTFGLEDRGKQSHCYYLAFSAGVA